MIDEFKKLIDDYLKWLKDRTLLKSIEDWIEITTPYIDRHNDYIQIYAKKDDFGNILLTDDGYTINDLELSGCNLDSPKRQELLKITLNGYGIKPNNKILETTATFNNFALKKHNLIQSILAINDLFYLSSPFITSLFLEDVTKYLDENKVRFTPKIKFTGKSGYDHMFDFVIPKSNKKPERIIKTINKPSKDNAESFLFAWLDTRDTRPSNSMSYIFLNDQEKFPSDSVISSFQNYNVNSILWSQRERYISELAA